MDDWLGSLDLPADADALLRMLTRVATYSHAPSIAAADMVVRQLQLALGPGVRYLHGGWQTMVSALADGVDVRRVAATAVGRDGRDVVVATGEGRFVATAAVVAVASPVQAATLVGSGPFQVGPPVEAACLDLATSQRAARGLLFGVDEPLYCSDHGAVARLAPAGGSVVHAARYLAPGEQHEPAATRAQLEAHARAAGVEPHHVVEARYLHRMTVAGALAVAEHGGLRGRPGIDAAGEHGVFLAGDWVGSEGHLLDASLASAEAAARAAVRVASMVGR